MIGQKKFEIKIKYNDIVLSLPKAPASLSDLKIEIVRYMSINISDIDKAILTYEDIEGDVIKVDHQEDYEILIQELDKKVPIELNLSVNDFSMIDINELQISVFPDEKSEAKSIELNSKNNSVNVEKKDFNSGTSVDINEFAMETDSINTTETHTNTEKKETKSSETNTNDDFKCVFKGMKKEIKNVFKNVEKFFTKEGLNNMTNEVKNLIDDMPNNLNSFKDLIFNNIINEKPNKSKEGKSKENKAKCKKEVKEKKDEKSKDLIGDRINQKEKEKKVDKKDDKMVNKEKKEKNKKKIDTKLYYKIDSIVKTYLNPIRKVITNDLYKKSLKRLERIESERKKKELEELVKEKEIISNNCNELTEHKYVTCDGCSKPVFGIRYKCAVCQNFDYCENCEENFSKAHEHAFLKIRQPENAPKKLMCIVPENYKSFNPSFHQNGPTLIENLNILKDYKIKDVNSIEEALKFQQEEFNKNEIKQKNCFVPIKNYSFKAIKGEIKNFLIKLVNLESTEWSKNDTLKCISLSTLKCNDIHLNQFIKQNQDVNVEVKLECSKVGQFSTFLQMSENNDETKLFGDMIQIDILVEDTMSSEEVLKYQKLVQTMKKTYEINFPDEKLFEILIKTKGNMDEALCLLFV